ncbi:MAG: Crp/Fnr family transcriptional regulator [Leptonema sp. (in: bacteria)]
MKSLQKKISKVVQNVYSPIWEKIKSPIQDPINQQLEIMSSLALFKDIPKNTIKLIRSRCHLRNYKKNEVIFNEGEPGIGLYIVIEGKVEIFREKNNKKTILSTLEVGDFFGELSLLLVDKPRSASAIALEPTTLLGFFNPDLKVIMKRNPHIASIILLNIANILGERLIKTNELLEKYLNISGEYYEKD